MAGREKEAAIARIWAHSLIALAAEVQREDELLEELDELVALLAEEPRLAALLTTPLVEDAAKQRVLERVLRGRASDLLTDFLQVLRRKSRLGLVGAVATAYRMDWLRRRHRVEVRVASAVPLTDELRQELRLAAAERTNRQPLLIERVDPALIGGLVVEIGDNKIDSTVARELARIEESLLARASRELLSGKTYFTESA